MARGSFADAFIVAGVNRYTARDKKYRAAASTSTIKRLGPSGSLKKKNNAREQTRAVAPRAINAVFFGRGVHALCYSLQPGSMGMLMWQGLRKYNAGYSLFFDYNICIGYFIFCIIQIENHNFFMTRRC